MTSAGRGPGHRRNRRAGRVRRVATRPRAGRAAAAGLARCVAWLAVLAGCGALAGGGTTGSGATGSGAGRRDAPATGYQRVIAAVLHSVVQVSGAAGTGSGVVLDRRGDIVTSAGVAGSAKRFRVRAPVISQALPARLIGSFPPDDLAVIRVERGASELAPAVWAQPSAVQP